MTQEQAASTPQQEIHRVRSRLMGGRGPGASPTEVLEHGRGRLVQAGVAVTRRRAETARDAALARGEDVVLVDAGLVVVADPDMFDSEGLDSDQTRGSKR